MLLFIAVENNNNLQPMKKLLSALWIGISLSAYFLFTFPQITYAATDASPQNETLVGTIVQSVENSFATFFHPMLSLFARSSSPQTASPTHTVAITTSSSNHTQVLAATSNNQGVQEVIPGIVTAQDTIPQGETISFTSVDTTAVNILQNASFEQQINGQPASWNYQLDSTTGNTFLSQEGIHSGNNGLKFLGGGSGNFGISQPGTETVPGRTYTFSVYIKYTNAPTFTFRLGFWNDHLNQEGDIKDYTFSGTDDWQRISMTTTTPGEITDSKNEFPLIEVEGLTTGAVYIDDAELEEGSVLTDFNSQQAYTSASGFGDGALLFSPTGDIMPAIAGTGSLGTPTDQFTQLNLTNANIDTNGDLNLNGNAKVNGSVTANDLVINGQTLFSSTNSATLQVNNGGTGQTSFTADGILYGNGSSAIQAVTPGTSGYILQSNGTNAPPSWVAATGLSAGSIAFSGITSGTNTQAAMIVGTGGALTFSGSGTINASTLNGNTFANPGSIGSGTAGSGAFTTVTGNTFNGLTVTNNGANTLTIANGKTLTVNNTITFGGTDGTTFTLPSSNDTLAGLAATQTLTNKTIAAGSNTITGLTNSNLSGSAGITNANLANSSITINTSGPLSGGNAVSLGNSLTLSCPTCVVTSGNLFTAAASSGSNSTIAQGGTLTLAAGTNISTTNNGSGTITVATSATPAFTTVNGLTLASNTDGFSVAGGTTSRTFTVTGSNITLTGGGNTLTLSGNASLNQSLLTSSTPSFSGLTINGNATLGQNTSNTITPNGLFNVSLIPSATSVNLGSSANNFGTLYVQNVISNATSGANGFWQLNSGALAPANITNDLLLGGTATTSAEFAFENMAGGTPTASISGNLSLAVPTGTNPAATLNILNGGSLNFQTSVGGNGGLNSALYIANNGNIGIGTINPGAPLQVASTANPGIQIGNGTNGYLALGGATLSKTSGAPLIFTVSQTQFALNGTGAPFVVNSTAGTTGIAEFEYNGAVKTIITLNGGIGSGTSTVGNGQMVVNQPLNAGNIFSASSSGTTVFNIDNSGNTRIVASLCVKATYTTSCAGNTAGTIYATNTTVQSADVAENYVSSQSLTPGTVIMPAEDGDNQAIVETTSAYQSQTIGIISTNPGVTLNSDATTDATHPNLYPVALQGRVPVRVSSINGNIQAGDLLTTSSIPGVAMKATQAGQIIGKALENYSSSNPNAFGTIMVFVNISWADPNMQIALTNTGDLSVNGQTVGTTPTPTPQQQTAQGVTEDQFTSLSTNVSALQDQVASLSSQLGRIADLQKTMNLTQLLTQTGSQSAVLGAATNSTANDMTVDGSLNVIGKTILSGEGITGTLTDGLLTINGLDTSTGSASATINTVSSPLRLQSLAAAGIDFENGKVTIDTNGNIVTNGEFTTAKLHIHSSDAALATLGNATIPAGQSSIVINTSAITSASHVFTSPYVALNYSLGIIDTKPGVSFTVGIPQPTTQPIRFSWWIVDDK